MNRDAVAYAQGLLNAHGFPCGLLDGQLGPRTRRAVMRFQWAWAGFPGAGGDLERPLDVDGIPGPHTQLALSRLPRLSWHYEVGHLRSKGDGTCYVDRRLVQALEGSCFLLGVDRTPIVSAYRDPIYNRAIEGAHFSMHLHGLAADALHSFTVDQVQALGLWSGIGDKDGMVRHVDLRHLSDENRTPDATPQTPARWHY